MKNFGELKNRFNEILSESIIKKDESGRNTFGKYIKMLKENEIVSFIGQICEGFGDLWGPSVSLRFGIFFMCPTLNRVKIYLGAGAGVIMVGAD